MLGINEQAENIQLMEPENYNAVEMYPLYDTVMICNIVPTLFPKCQWYQTYQDLAVPSEIPFFNVRNIGIAGEAYCNLDSSEHLPYPYHICSIGVYVTIPIASMWHMNAAPGDALFAEQRASDVFFQTEFPRFSAVNLRVGSDDKYLAKVNMCSSGHGIAGWVKVLDSVANYSGGGVGNMNVGTPHRKNVVVFPEPIQVPRDRNMSCQIRTANYLREALAKLAGPGKFLCDNEPSFPNAYAAPALIRIILGGFREVQLRNNLRF